MGSDSDLPTMKDAAEVLDQFGVAYELTVVSAHRTPTRMYEYAQTAAARGVQVRGPVLDHHGTCWWEHHGLGRDSKPGTARPHSSADEPAC